MTTKLMIYSNLNFKKIFEQIFFNLKPEFKKLTDLNKRIKATDCSIILVENLKMRINYYIEENKTYGWDLDVLRVGEQTL